MQFTRLENEKFTVKAGDNKPNKKYFPYTDFRSVGNTKYEFSSISKKDKMVFQIRYTNGNKVFKNIANNMVNKSPDFKKLEDVNSFFFAYTKNNDVVVISCHLYPKNYFNFPVQVNFDSNEMIEMRKNYLFANMLKNVDDKTKFYIVSCRSYIFETMYKEYVMDANVQSFLSENNLDLIYNLDPNQTYDDEFFADNNISPRPVIYYNGLINIPIFEKLGENWIFYHHNYDKYKDKLNKR